jgi:hypothetical protein
MQCLLFTMMPQQHFMNLNGLNMLTVSLRITSKYCYVSQDHVDNNENNKQSFVGFGDCINHSSTDGT